MVVGLAASEPWLMELPWCSQVRRPEAGAGSTGASVRSATSAVSSLYGSQISTVLSAPGSPSKRTAPAGPELISALPVDRSMVTVLPPVADACPAGRPSTSRSYRPSGRGGAPV